MISTLLHEIWKTSLLTRSWIGVIVQFFLCTWVNVNEGSAKLKNSSNKIYIASVLSNIWRVSFIIGLCLSKWAIQRVINRYWKQGK